MFVVKEKMVYSYFSLWITLISNPILMTLVMREFLSDYSKLSFRLI